VFVRCVESVGGFEGGAGGECTPHRGSGVVPPRKTFLPQETCHIFRWFFGTW
jgi:hypothetical protein